MVRCFVEPGGGGEDGFFVLEDIQEVLGFAEGIGEAIVSEKEALEALGVRLIGTYRRVGHVIDRRNEAVMEIRAIELGGESAERWAFGVGADEDAEHVTLAMELAIGVHGHIGMDASGEVSCGCLCERVRWKGEGGDHGCLAVFACKISEKFAYMQEFL